jgi:hypothetical protein
MPFAPAPAGTNEHAWEDTMINAADYRAMAAEHHRLAGMCGHLNLANNTFGLKKSSRHLRIVRNACTARPPRRSVKMVAAGNIAEPCRVRAVGYRLWGPIVCQFKARTNVIGGHPIRG